MSVIIPATVLIIIVLYVGSSVLGFSVWAIIAVLLICGPFLSLYLSFRK